MPTSKDLQKAQESVVPTTLYVHSGFDEYDLPVLIVDSPELFNLEEMGILSSFDVDRLDVMKARALAFGVTLERR